MYAPVLTRRLFWWAAEVALLTGTVGASVILSRSEEWQPLSLVAFLLVLTLVGEWLIIKMHSGNMTAAFVALVLAMSLLGPVPAVAFGIAAMVLTSTRRRLRPALWLCNLTTFAFSLFAGGLMVRALAGDLHDPRNHHFMQGVLFALIVFGVFLVVTVLNFLLVALDVHITEGRSLRAELNEVFFPLLPGQLVTGALATILVVAYTNVGLPILFAAIALLLVFRHLTVALLRSEDRADQLEARSIQLASLQFGVLATLMNALALRDRRTARHAVAVARYAKALAIEVGCSEEEQEVVHTAGLLHDIGKFTWSDRVLHPESITDEDLAVIRRHPQDGATLVGKLDGYGPVADAILYHHERVDGGGYPAGLISNEIPLASRIVAVCSTFDAMTAPESYRSPMKPGEAMAEMGRIAGRQLDAHLVESFVGMLEREGLEAYVSGGDVDLDRELALEQRVRKMAQPSPS
jgi:putative nucleotidyltransferase with HDIG domain